MYQPLQPMTFANAKNALDEGLRAIAAGQQSIDLAGVATIDSSAVAVLLAWQRAALTQAGVLRFANPPASLSRLAALYGVADLLQIGADAPRL